MKGLLKFICALGFIVLLILGVRTLVDVLHDQSESRYIRVNDGEDE